MVLKPDIVLAGEWKSFMLMDMDLVLETQESDVAADSELRVIKSVSRSAFYGRRMPGSELPLRAGHPAASLFTQKRTALRPRYAMRAQQLGWARTA